VDCQKRGVLCEAIDCVLGCQRELASMILDFNTQHAENISIIDFSSEKVSYVDDFVQLLTDIRNSSALHSAPQDTDDLIKKILDVEQCFYGKLSRLQIHILFASFTNYDANEPCQRSIRLFTSTCVSFYYAQLIFLLCSTISMLGRPENGDANSS
jgi:hypothetical protein